MARMVLGIALCAVHLFAQGSTIPSPIAITGNASQVVFASIVPLVGSKSGGDNIYKYSGGAATTVYPGLVDTCGPPGTSWALGTCTLGSAVTGLQVSSDGGVLAVSITVHTEYCDFDCSIGFPTGQIGSYQIEALVTSSGTSNYSSSVALSRNGRFLLHACAFSFCLDDLVQGRTQTVPFFAESVANDGTIVSANTSGALSIWNPQSGVRTVVLNPPPGNSLVGNPVIDPLASHAAVQSAGTYIVDLSSGSATAIPTGFSFSGFSDSGAKILLTGKDSTSVNQAFLADIDGTNLQQVTSEPTGIGSVAVSSDASVLVAVNGAGDVLRYDVAARAREVIFSTPPQMGTSLTGTPGSAYSVWGTALAGGYAYAPPGGSLPTSLGGVQVLIDGTPVPLIAVSPGSITCQLPWELTLGTHTLAVNRPVNSPFAANNQVSLTAGSHYPDFVVVAHQDWTPITSSQPAQNGEILHFYMTGLGSVTPSIATGVITPVGPLFIARSPNCRGIGATFDTLFAGLAPGLAGIYQVDMKISALTASTQPYTVSYDCGTANISLFAQGPSN
jgi:uncharacterized protein (TIGR03437 family)